MVRFFTLRQIDASKSSPPLSFPLCNNDVYIQTKERTFEEYVYETGGARQHLAGGRVDVRLSNPTL